MKLWIPATDSVAIKKEVTDQLANADYLLTKNRTGVRLDENIEVVYDEKRASKSISETCGQNRDTYKNWADDDSLNVYYAWGSDSVRCDPSKRGFRAVYVKRRDRLGTILHEILYDTGLLAHIETVGYCEWDPLGCGHNLLADYLKGYFRDRLTPAQIFWMYRESGSLLVWLLNRGTSDSAIEGRSCESARSRLPYLGPWVSKFCVPGGHPKIARPTEASIVGWLAALRWLRWVAGT